MCKGWRSVRTRRGLIGCGAAPRRRVSAPMLRSLRARLVFARSGLRCVPDRRRRNRGRSCRWAGSTATSPTRGKICSPVIRDLRQSFVRGSRSPATSPSSLMSTARGESRLPPALLRQPRRHACAFIGVLHGRFRLPGHLVDDAQPARRSVRRRSPQRSASGCPTAST
ncbi:hypothetical protein HBB16_01530 [Pseudonocardia sp. MCCB 268]|nr:hypothetical protein [Pseudonocardia cytotoxica]